LPRVSTLATHLNWGSGRVRNHYDARGINHDDVDWDAVEEQAAELLSDHCLNAPAPILWPTRQLGLYVTRSRSGTHAGLVARSAAFKLPCARMDILVVRHPGTLVLGRLGLLGFNR